MELHAEKTSCSWETKGDNSEELEGVKMVLALVVQDNDNEDELTD
jgi:hypothetical protein